MKKIIYLLAATVLFSCAKEEQKDYLKHSKNSLNYQITPAHKKDKKGLMFSDQGAWFAYSFSNAPKDITGFSGPFLMTQQWGIWSSKALINLQIKDQQWKEVTTESYNSHLVQKYLSNNLELTQKLVFLSGHTALIKSSIKNISNSTQTVAYSFKNEQLLADGLKLIPTNNQLTIKSSKTDAIGQILFPKNISLSATDSTYVSNEISLKLKANETKDVVVSQTFIFSEYSWEDELKSIHNADFSQLLKERKTEKNTQLKATIENRKAQFQDPIYAEVLAKAQLTLQNNWRIPSGEIKYEGLFPSYHYGGFHGFWSWDSWKHAVGLSFYNLDLAKKQMKQLFEFQDEHGFVADVVYRNGGHNLRDTKPPLSAWAVAKIYEKDKDTEFVKYMYPKLKLYHQWWYNKRDNDQDGLCEYGSTDGSLIAAKWESGMDNAIRFDNSKIVKNGENAYSIDQESVDLNAYLYAEKLYLAQLAKALNKQEEVTQYTKEAAALKNRIQTQFYDKNDGWFYDTNLEGTEFIKGEGSEGWTALWAKAATQEQAEAVRKRMLNPKNSTPKFHSKP